MAADLSGARVALFVPCYVDQLAPRVGFAARRVLARFGVEAEFVPEPTCCGQPLANIGCAAEARPLASAFARSFASFDYVVCPSGSCVAMVRHHYRDLLGERGRSPIFDRTMELCEFLFDVVEIESVEGRFAHRVGLHRSCHGLRGLRLGKSSELVGPPADPVAALLESIDGLELVPLERADECCGFGGSFSVVETGVSAMMGRDRIRDHARAGAEVIASIDLSCLIHLEGLMRRDGDARRVMHVAELLEESFEAPA